MLITTQDNEEIIERVAALDIGKAELMCCVRVPDEEHPGRRLQEVQAYPTLTRSVLRLADHLAGLGVTRVVMEATADYWKPVFYLLEAAGFETWLVNAKDVKHLPGRPKTDPLTELTAAVDQVSGWAGVLVASVARHEHRRRWTAGSVPACGAAARVAGVDRGCVRAVPAGRCGRDGRRRGRGVLAGAGGVRAYGCDAAVVCV
ncbi:MAG TPA: transposase [Streptosporangiaceae bacterium]|nr:transposase [Streptosporangiaceae bacterium]